MQRRSALRVFDVNIGVFVEEKSNEVQIAAAYGVCKNRIAVAIDYVYIRAAMKKRLRDLHIAFACS